jgi:hypothetical protein
MEKETKKTVDAVAMTRHIRDRHYEATKNMTPEERQAYYREKGRSIHDQLVQQARRKKSGQAT